MDLNQVDILAQRCELHEFEVQKSEKRAEEAIQLAAEESAKSKAAKEVIKFLTDQVMLWAIIFPLLSNLIFLETKCL